MIENTGSKLVIFYCLGFLATCLVWTVVPITFEVVYKAFLSVFYPQSNINNNNRTSGGNTRGREIDLEAQQIAGNGSRQNTGSGNNNSEGVEVVHSNVREEHSSNNVEVFLADGTRQRDDPLSIPLNRDREEFISNLLICKRVVLTKPEYDENDKSGEQTTTDSTTNLSTTIKGDLYQPPYKSNLKEDDDEEQDYINDLRTVRQQCPICLVEYSEGDEICWSHNKKCNHHFHAKCIKMWLCQERDDCPCCRHNYLALSDDEDNDDDDGENINIDDDDDEDEHDNGSDIISIDDGDLLSDVDSIFLETSESLSDDGTTMSDVNAEIILSAYLSQFTAMTDVEFGRYMSQFQDGRVNSQVHGAAPETVGNNQGSRNGMEISDDDGNDGDDSLSTDSLYIEGRQWSNDDDATLGADVESHLDEEEWSCPSGDDMEVTVQDISPVRRPFRRTVRSRMARPAAFSTSAPCYSNEWTQSLQLGDLILDGLMTRLERRDERYRGDDDEFLDDLRSSHTESSNSVYTEGNATADPQQTGLRNEASTCAICRKEYHVNEELCWSQDPACNHVFHRQCMEVWIQHHNFCPLCKSRDDDDDDDDDDANWPAESEVKGDSSPPSLIDEDTETEDATSPSTSTSDLGKEIISSSSADEEMSQDSLELRMDTLQGLDEDEINEALSVVVESLAFVEQYDEEEG